MSTQLGKRRSRFKESMRRNEVSLYVPSPELIAAAEERTEGMLCCFLVAVADSSWDTSIRYLQRLLNSAYIQGAQDTAMVAAQLAQKETP